VSRVDQLAAFVQQVWPDLDLFTYYQLLEISEDAAPDDVRAAFYRQAARLHPDRFAGLADSALRKQLVAIYARVAEAYKILSEPRKRAAYDSGLDAGQVRYVETDREKKGPQNPEDAVSAPQAKKFLRLALQGARAGDWKGAHMNLKFALSYEPSNEYLRRKMAEAEQELKTRQRSGLP
jgi:DnaJ-class molecular chaperone